MKHVRELAYDLADCVELVVHLDDKPIFWRRLLPVCIIGPLPLDQAVTEIEELKGRAKELSECYSRYSNISEPAAVSKLIVMPQQQQEASSRATGATSSNMLAKESDAARRQRGIGDLTQLVTNKDNKDPQLQVISVWGTGGDLGTTSIIRKAYNDPEICRNFACRAWVKLMHPFNPHEFVRRFMAQVYTNTCEKQGARVGAHVLKKMEARQEDLVEEFVQEVNTKTYLVVLENLNHMLDWDAVRTFLPDMKNGSWIIVSTQQFEIASLSIGHTYQSLELKQFSPEHSVCAFFKQGAEGYTDKEKPIMCQVSPYSSTEKILSPKRIAVKNWMENNPLVGRDLQMNELRIYTTSPRFNSSPVISVWGIAGIGKSALVRHLQYDRMLHSNQFNMYNWVDVSHPFNLRDFSRSLLSVYQSENYYLERDPIKECRELLSEHHCFVVIDGLQSKEEWDSIEAALVSRPSTSVIIVITTEASVATYCTTNKEQVFNVKGLEAAAAMDLFRKEVHKKNPSSPLYRQRDAELEQLILKCGGLPKVIVSIAALLARETEMLMDNVHSLNHKFIQHLETNPEYESLRGLFDWMHSYFSTFPDSLKPCIFYLSVFPPGRSIQRRRLIRRWIAEGYSRDSDEESAVNKGEKFFSKLLDLSIIEEIPRPVSTEFSGDTNTKVVSRRVNGFIRDYIVSRRMEENFVFELGPDCALTTQRTGRHLVVLKSWDRDRIVFESTDFSRLRSLTVFGKWESFFISQSMWLLWVLDLEDALGVKDEDLKKVVERLHRLKFLSLRGCIEICHLPSSLGDLRQLQTLDVRQTSIVTLPVNIAKLQKLQYIRAGTTDPASTLSVSSSWLPKFHRHRGLIGVEVPRGIGKLTALHTLGVVNVSASGGKAILEELKKLTQLRKLGVSGISRHNSREFFSATSGHVHLESLLVRLDRDSQNCLDEISLPWENLRSLTLCGLQDKLPLSRNPLSKLRKLDLEMGILQEHDIKFLASLPELCILRLQVKQLKLHFYAEICGVQLVTFSKVKILEIACSSSELYLTFGSKSMKNLEVLMIDYSSASYELAGLTNLSELKEVLLKGTNDEAFRTQFANTLANHPKSPTVKLEGLPPSS